MEVNYTIKEVHISQIYSGDTIIHSDGLMRTVCSKNIGYTDFMGTTLFGDSYKLGHTLVKKVVFNTFKS